MASIRKTKKEIEYLTGAVISDCYLAIYFQPDAKRDRFIDIINRAVELHNDMKGRINASDGGVSPRKYYRRLRQEFYAGIDELFKAMSDVCKSE